MDKMNKRGFLRIVEASVSIVILIGVLFLLFLHSKPQINSPGYDESIRDLLEEIAKNESLRISVLQDNEEIINEFLDRRIVSSSINYTFSVCGISEACGLESYIPGEVFAQERVISADVDQLNYEPRKIRIFVWQNT